MTRKSRDTRLSQHGTALAVRRDLGGARARRAGGRKSAFTGGTAQSSRRCLRFGRLFRAFARGATVLARVLALVLAAAASTSFLRVLLSLGLGLGLARLLARLLGSASPSPGNDVVVVVDG